MEIRIPKVNCEHLKEISNYNHNYYKIPFEINECDVILEICDEDYDAYNYITCKVSSGKVYTIEDISCGYGFDKCKNHLIIDSNLYGVVRC